MFKKLAEKKERKKQCFDARKKLIVIDDKPISNKVGCIHMSYSIGMCIAEPWVENMNPEDTYRIAGPYISYCSEFDKKNPLVRQCKNTSCPMYVNYVRYLNACRALRLARGK